MFQVGQVVSYGASGVCTVEAIEMRSMSRAGTKKQEYYVLRPMSSPSCLTYVPTGNETLTARMRCVLSREEIDAMLRRIRDDRLPWIEDPRQRAEQYGAILSAGLSEELLKLISCLFLEKKACAAKGKRFGAADERLLTAAERVVSEEFAYTLQIRPNQVSAYIAARME